MNTIHLLTSSFNKLSSSNAGSDYNDEKVSKLFVFDRIVCRIFFCEILTQLIHSRWDLFYNLLKDFYLKIIELKIILYFSNILEWILNLEVIF